MLDRHLTGDDGRSALVAIIDDFEEITTLVAGERGEAPIIEDEQVDPREHLEEPRIASVAAGERQSLEQPWQPMVEDGTVVAAGLVAERAGNPALAGSMEYLLLKVLLRWVITRCQRMEFRSSADSRVHKFRCRSPPRLYVPHALSA